MMIALFGGVTFFMNSGSFRMAFMKGVLGFSLVALIIPELLGYFNLISFRGVMLSWAIVDLLLVAFLIRTKRWTHWLSIKSRMAALWNSLPGLQRYLIGFVLLVILLTLAQGIIYPTNNWDSMSYHMARIVHWIQNGNLDHYITPHYSQLISPPFAELMVMQVNLLAGNDYFSNTVQWFFLVAALVPISLIAKQLGMDRKGQLLAMLVMITLPEVLLLASSTHTELVASFFIASAIYLMHLSVVKNTRNSFVFLGLALGLAVATKSTAYIYVAPFMVVGLVVFFYRIVTQKARFQTVGSSLLIALFVLPNVGHFVRNYTLNHSVFGTNEAIHNYYVNEAHSLPFLISNISRNMSLQFGVPKVAPVVYNTVAALHDRMGVDVNQPEITSHVYTVDPLATHENNGANLYHTILLLFSLLYIVINWKKQHPLLLVYAACIVLSFLLFCWYLKWQPWAKLHVPFYILYAVVIAQFLRAIKWPWLRSVLSVGLMVTGLLYVLFNFSRPFITWTPFTSEIRMTDTRYEKYFSRFPEFYPDYNRVNELIKGGNFNNIGLLLTYHEMEYQLFTDVYRSERKSIHLKGHDITANLEQKPMEIDVLVSTTCQDQIEVNGKTFRNITPENNGHLSLYLPE